MSKQKKGLLAIIGLILATTAALAAMGAGDTLPGLSSPVSDGDRVSLSTEMVQEKMIHVPQLLPRCTLDHCLSPSFMSLTGQTR